jgi:hypothetical protein
MSDEAEDLCTDGTPHDWGPGPGGGGVVGPGLSRTGTVEECSKCRKLRDEVITRPGRSPGANDLR